MNKQTEVFSIESSDEHIRWCNLCEQALFSYKPKGFDRQVTSLRHFFTMLAQAGWQLAEGGTGVDSCKKCIALYIDVDISYK